MLCSGFSVSRVCLWDRRADEKQAGAFSVANLYYTNPILNILADEFGVSNERAALIPSVTQAGYAGGLLFVIPLGDILRRRYLVLGLVFSTAFAVWIVQLLTSHSRLCFQRKKKINDEVLVVGLHADDFVLVFLGPLVPRGTTHRYPPAHVSADSPVCPTTAQSNNDIGGDVRRCSRHPRRAPHQRDRNAVYLMESRVLVVLRAASPHLHVTLFLS